MKNFYQLSLWCIMACTLPLTLSCSSDEELSPGPDPDPIIPDNGIVSLSAEGQQTDVTIPNSHGRQNRRPTGCSCRRWEAKAARA